MSSPDTPKIKVTCAACGNVYHVKAELAGRSAKCGCGAPLKIPPLPKSPITDTMPVSDIMSNSTIATSISASLRDTVASTKPAPKPVARASRPQSSSPASNEPQSKAPAEISGDAFELEPTIDPPKVVPVADFDEDVVLQPVAPVTPPSTVEAAIDEGAEKAKPDAKKDEGGTSAALQFLGICGIVIMGMSALVGLLNIAGAIYMVTRPNVSISACIVVFGIVAFQSLIYFVVFRLGQGLLRCERASLQGLIVLYVLGLGAVACGMAAGYFVAGAIVMAALSIFMLPPIIVGVMSWSDLYGDDD